MKLPRPLLALACVAGLTAPAIANACLQPSERVALEVRTLQIRMMVGALQCQQDANYNEFVRRNQGDLHNAVRTAERYFTRPQGGGGGQRRWNQIETEIAGVQSQEHSRAGDTLFCRDTTTFYQNLRTINGTAGLARFAVERNVLQAYHAPTCTGTEFGRPSRPARPAAARR